ncbi:MAG: MipA/OmpV family protein [Nevskia sp.]|nr:MipA/OmpV family protein [Nevskia sp.]
MSAKPFNKLVCALGMIAVLDSSGAFADDISSPSADAALAPGAEARPLWEVGLAGGVGSFSDYPASDRYRVRALPLPYFIYRGGIFRSDASGPRLHTGAGNVEFEFSAGGTLSSTSHSGPREGMPKLDYLLEAGPNTKITLGKPTPSSRLLVDLPVRAAVSTNFSSRFDWRGVIFTPDLAYEDEAILGSRWGGRAAVGVEFATARLQQFWYGVAPQYANTPEQPDRSAYDAHGGYLGSRLTLSAYRPLTRNFNIYFAGQFDLYAGAENQNSPLFKSKTGAGGIIGFAWSIWQSKERESVIH